MGTRSSAVRSEAARVPAALWVTIAWGAPVAEMPEACDETKEGRFSREFCAAKSRVLREVGVPKVCCSLSSAPQSSARWTESK